MIQIYNNKHLTWDGTTSINHYELFADTVTDLPSDPYYFSSPDKGSYKMAQGSIAWVIDVSEIYMLDSGGTWVLESISGGGGGGGGTTDYNALTNKPSINSVELSGNKTLSDLGIQSAIDSSHKLSADLVTNGTTNKFNMQADWTQADNTSGDFIKNKPTLGTAATTDATAYATAAQGTKADTAIQSAGTGLSASGTTLNHSNSVTAKTTQGFAQIAYDAQGHITGSTAATTAQVNAIDSGITSTDVAQIGLNKNNILSIQQEQITQNNEIATLREITNCKLYGYRIDKQDTNPDTRVTYLYDAVGMTPAYMDFSGGSFNYGSWADIWFIAKNRPVALKYDGTVDYELSHTDFTKKIDGETASDVSDSAYGGNFMSEIPLVYVKRWEDTRYNYVVFCETKPNDDYLAQAHTNANGTVNPYIYLPMFKGSIDANNKLRSLMGTIPNGNTTAANEVSYVENCGNGWQLWDKAKIDLIMDLIVLITKSTNCRGKIGNGDCQTYNASDTRKDSKNNDANGKMMSGYEVGDTTRSTNAQFYGAEGTDSTNYGKHHMIAFYIEDLWANRWDRCLGFNLVDNVYKVKMAPPYALDSDSTYQTLSVTPPNSTEGWLKNVSSGVYGDVPTEVDASNVSGFANYFYKNASGARLSLFGGGANNGLSVGRYWHLGNGATRSGWFIGGSPCYNAL